MRLPSIWMTCGPTEKVWSPSGNRQSGFGRSVATVASL
jgi:hypothetical protein